MAKKAWEYEDEWIRAAVPVSVEDDQEEDWLEAAKAGEEADKRLFTDWRSEVPGSKAPSHLIPAAIACMAQKGFDVSAAEVLIEEGLAAAEKRDGGELQRITAEIFRILNTAELIPEHPYLSYRIYRDPAEVLENSAYPEAAPYDVGGDDFARKIRAGWTGQLIGGCLGTQIEGYTTDNIRKKFGEIRGYLRKPETYNDDITYELAWLEAFAEKGYGIASDDVARAWLTHISEGYSAERVALDNLKRGIFPPESGTECNYFSDWIGSQMRTMVSGMSAPGDPALAAKLAASDSVVSHSNSGMIGGVFNAVLVSLCFTETDMRAVLEKTIKTMPARSEYAAVVEHALSLCREKPSWEEAWAACEEKYREYHWIHAYPNAAAEIIALWYGNMDFDETAHIIAMEGRDADCTSAPVLNALAIMLGTDQIDERWIRPIGNDIYTTMRKIRHTTIDELCEKHVRAVRRAAGSKEY